MKKVTVYTQVYNTKPYLEQCISSVLSQTYSNFEYILVDNGCTDGSSDLLRQFAGSDDRIRLIRFEENQYYPRLRIMEEHASGEYYATLDSDDWWEPDFLERLIEFLEKNGLDLAVTGTTAFFESEGISRTMRKLDQAVVLDRQQFAQMYPQLWVFPSTIWASVMKLSIAGKIRSKNINNIAKMRYPYGGDTMEMLHYLMCCSRIGIDNSALYHYRIHPKSVSYQYNPRRFDANIAYYEQIREFLVFHEALDAEKQDWLKRVHLNSMTVTLGLLRDAHIPAEQNLAECLRIAQHPLTETALTCSCDERNQWYALMWEILSMGLTDTSASPAAREPLAQTLELLSPSCGGAFGPEDLGLLAREPTLWDAVKADDPDCLANLLLGLIAEKRFSKQYNLGAILHRLIPESSPLRNITDTRFFRTYAQDCAEIMKGNHIAALDHMTELLLESKKLYAPEQFFDLYLSLAALENQVPAFLFGKLQLAELYLGEGRKEDCRAVADELAEMGLENEEFSALCQKLQKLEEQP